MTRLSESVAQATALLRGGDLAGDAAVRELLDVTGRRRGLDLSDLSPVEQAELVAERAQQLFPSPTALAERVDEAARAGRPFVAKFGIDPTGSEVHLGHAVPMLVLSRFQRLGHEVVFIVGDLTASIGDPSGRSDERPHLSAADIAANLATYREQVSPFFDFSRAQFRHNGEWLGAVTLPRLIEVTAQIPVSIPLQREDFRSRLAGGHGLSLAELLYSVAMALDSVEVRCDVEVGGLDQFLNMQMGRKVMEICGLAPELVVATPLVEGTDGTGAKMSKSRGNYVPLTAPAQEVFGKLMSVPDRLVSPYLKALTEWRDSEIAVAEERLAAGSLHPMDLKRLLAGDVTAALHGLDAAIQARAGFAERFSRRSYRELTDLPTVADTGQTVTEAVRALGFAPTASAVRRLAQQDGLRLVVEVGDSQDQLRLSVDEAREPLASVLAERVGVGGDALERGVYLKAGRKLARIEARP